MHILTRRLLLFFSHSFPGACPSGGEDDNYDRLPRCKLSPAVEPDQPLVCAVDSTTGATLWHRDDVRIGDALNRFYPVVVTEEMKETGASSSSAAPSLTATALSPSCRIVLVSLSGVQQIKCDGTGPIESVFNRTILYPTIRTTGFERQSSMQSSTSGRGLGFFRRGEWWLFRGNNVSSNVTVSPTAGGSCFPAGCDSLDEYGSYQTIEDQPSVVGVLLNVQATASSSRLTEAR